MSLNSSDKEKLETIFNDIDKLSVNSFPVKLESGMFAEMPPIDLKKTLEMTFKMGIQERIQKDIESFSQPKAILQSINSSLQAEGE